mmetsp:Transcript_136611/g.323628  ORF Transcript_136611/g.323628 Transcript_136611/m.323628 type:complete len:293 (-) Transcript_136611:354-1232(-)
MNVSVDPGLMEGVDDTSPGWSCIHSVEHSCSELDLSITRVEPASLLRPPRARSCAPGVLGAAAGSLVRGRDLRPTFCSNGGLGEALLEIQGDLATLRILLCQRTVGLESHSRIDPPEGAKVAGKNVGRRERVVGANGRSAEGHDDVPVRCSDGRPMPKPRQCLTPPALGISQAFQEAARRFLGARTGGDTAARRLAAQRLRGWSFATPVLQRQLMNLAESSRGDEDTHVLPAHPEIRPAHAQMGRVQRDKMPVAYTGHFIIQLLADFRQSSPGHQSAERVANKVDNDPGLDV